MSPTLTSIWAAAARVSHVALRVTFAVFLSVAFAVLVTSCACGEPSRRNDPACVVERALVDCTTDAVTSVVPEFLPVLVALVSAVTGADGSVDWSKVEGAVEHLGVRDGLCLIAELEDALGKRLASGPAAARQAAEVRSGAEALRARRWPGLRARLPGGAVR